MKKKLIALLGVLLLFVGCSEDTPLTPPVMYSVSIIISPDGAGSVNPAFGSFDSGSKTTFKAAANDGYVFDKWSGDMSGTSASQSMVVSKDLEIEAHFKRDPQGDDDSDGVTNALDQCNSSPADLKVDENGCTPRTFVPDDNFEQYLLDLGHDDVLDDYVYTENIETITKLEMENKGIKDLTGIEDFAAIEELNVNKNELQVLNVENNTKLRILHCMVNQISELNLSKLNLLEDLLCLDNNMTNLDVSNQKELIYLQCGGNDFKAIDVSENIKLQLLSITFCGAEELILGDKPDLIELHGFHNNLKVLELDGLASLKYIGFNHNTLEKVTLKNLPELNTVTIQHNQIESFTMENTSKLEDVNLDDNKIKELDFSSQKNLISLILNNNSLTYLNVKNGKNDLMRTFRIKNNPDLKCVQVDDLVDANLRFSAWIDNGLVLSENCD